MTDPLLLDTCAVMWLGEDAELSDLAVDTLDEASRTGGSVLVSPITAWEIGLLVSKNRFPLAVNPQVWFEGFMSQGADLAKMPVNILIASSHLPGRPPNDPADRIIIATAREYGYTIITRDRQILDFAESGHVKAVPC